MICGAIVLSQWNSVPLPEDKLVPPLKPLRCNTFMKKNKSWSGKINRSQRVRNVDFFPDMVSIGHSHKPCPKRSILAFIK